MGTEESPTGNQKKIRSRLLESILISDVTRNVELIIYIFKHDLQTVIIKKKNVISFKEIIYKKTQN